MIRASVDPDGGTVTGPPRNSCGPAFVAGATKQRDWGLAALTPSGSGPTINALGDVTVPDAGNYLLEASAEIKNNNPPDDDPTSLIEGTCSVSKIGDACSDDGDSPCPEGFDCVDGTCEQTIGAGASFSLDEFQSTTLFLDESADLLANVKVGVRCRVTTDPDDSPCGEGTLDLTIVKSKIKASLLTE